MLRAGIVLMSGCPGGPGDKHPNWITVAWPPETTEILEWQWREVLIPYWKELVAFAAGKAQSVSRRQPNSLVIGSDTMISVGDHKIGKPATRGDAARMLRLLSGKAHQIFTSVAIVDGTGGPGLTTVVTVYVDMLPYMEEEIQRYLNCQESVDKAGAYSIQGEGRKLISAIKGDYLAAVGMPLRPIADYLKARNIAIPGDIGRLYLNL